jgi:hypothetical protein
LIFRLAFTRGELLMKPLPWLPMLWPSYKRSFDFSGPVKELRSFSPLAEARSAPPGDVFLIW